jgi:type II secretion system protein C
LKIDDNKEEWGDIMKKTGVTYKYKVFWIFRLALLLILGCAVLKTVLMLQGADETFVPNSTIGAEHKIQVEPAVVSERSLEDYSAIFERDLFGRSAPSMGPEKPQKVDSSSDPNGLNKEELSIALLGTVAGSPEVSRAIIEDVETNILSLYKVGDTVANASIEDIGKNAVVLLHQGQRKTVHLGARESKRRETKNVESVLARNAPRAHERDLKERSYTTFTDKLRHAATMLPEAIIEPYTVDGNIEGLKITGLEDIRPLEELGLRNGDVIRSVNGHRLTSKQKAYQISKKVRSQMVVSIELMRGSRIETFSFDLG